MSRKEHATISSVQDAKITFEHYSSFELSRNSDKYYVDDILKRHTTAYAKHLLLVHKIWASRERKGSVRARDTAKIFRTRIPLTNKFTYMW